MVSYNNKLIETGVVFQKGIVKFIFFGVLLYAFASSIFQV